MPVTSTAIMPFNSYLFTYKKKQYEGYCLGLCFINSTYTYLMFCYSYDRQDYTYMHFCTDLVEDAEKIESLHFFTIEELTDTFTSMTDTLYFLGFGRVPRLLFGFGLTSVECERMQAVDYLYFKRKDRIMELCVPYDDYEKPAKTFTFPIYALRTISEEQFNKAKRREGMIFYTDSEGVVEPRRLTSSSCKELMEREIRVPPSITLDVTGVEFGDFMVFNNNIPQNNELFGNGFRYYCPPMAIPRHR